MSPALWPGSAPTLHHNSLNLHNSTRCDVIFYVLIEWGTFVKQIIRIKTTVFILLFASSAVTTGHAASLYDIYKQALENDPVYEIGRHEKEASSEIYRQARALLLPQATLDFSRSSIRQNILSADNTVFASGKTQYPESVISLKLNQSIFDVAKWAAFGKAKIEVKRLAVELESLRQDLTQRVVERYFTVLAAGAGLDYVRAEKKAVGHQLELSKVKRKKGLIRITELQDAQARVLQVDAREIELENRMSDSLLALAEILGQLPDTLSPVAPDILFQTPDPGNPRAWVDVAHKQNTEVMIKRFEIEEAGKEVQRQNAGHFPTLNLSVDVNNRDTGGTLFGGGSQVQTSEVKVTFSIPLFEGGAVISRVKAAIGRHSKAKVELKLVLRQVERQARAAYDGVVNSIAKIQSFRKLVEANESLVQAKLTAYESGLLSNLGVLDAQRDLFFARSEYTLAQHEYVINVMALKRAAGTLNDNDVQEISHLMLSGDAQISLIDMLKTVSISSSRK